MKTIVFLLAIYLLHIFGVRGSSLFTSTDGMKKLSGSEHSAVDALEVVVEKMQAKLTLMKKIAAEIRQVHQSSPDNLELAGHPIQAYHLVKRWHRIGKMFAYEEEKKVPPSIKHIPVSTDCHDEHPSCKEWARVGECINNAAYMLEKCKASCKLCRRMIRKESLMTGVTETLRTRDKVTIPDEDDYIGACQGMIRLQRTYELETDNIMTGNIRGQRPMTPLHSDDYFYIGKEAVKMSEWGYAVQWLKEALYSTSEPTLKGKIHVQLIKAYVGMNDVAKARYAIIRAFGGKIPVLSSKTCVDNEDRCEKWAGEGECKNNPPYMKAYCKYSCNECAPGKESFPQQNVLFNQYASVQRQAQIYGWKHTYPEPNSQRTIPEDQEWKPKYEELCRGQGTRHYPDAVCRLRPALLPYYVYKEEILCMNPRISMVYDVITDRESEIIRNTSKSKMQRGKVGSDSRFSNDRVSKVGWLADDEYYVRTLSERIEMITGLEVTHQDMMKGRRLISSDELQVVNYGIGGHYEPHTDYFEFVDAKELESDIAKTVNTSGDRVATFLMYLTEVEAGGSTVYPRAKVHVSPVKNAAAFWYNSELSGKYDPLTLHAGCPILLGEKWVANKWVREFGNEFKRKCALSPDAKYS